MLREGTAIDATIATLFCNSAVIGNSIGMGGGFVMTIYRKRQGKIYNLMARETAPAASYPGIFVNNTSASGKGWTPKLEIGLCRDYAYVVTGPLSVAVPGELMGYWEAKQKFGSRKVSWKSLIEPSIKLCEEGIRVSEYFSDFRKSQGIMKKIRADPELT